MDDKGHSGQSKALSVRGKSDDLTNFVLDKTIFNKVFEKDVRRVYVYKKAERIAKAIHLVTPAFKDSRPLRERLQRASVELIDASARPLSESREILSRELLTLVSILSMARGSQMLSAMNAEIITREAHALLQDISAYEDARVTLDEAPTLSAISKSLPSQGSRIETRVSKTRTLSVSKGQYKGQRVVRTSDSSRKESVLSILQSKGPSYIKDISMVIRDVSEKTIQRELQSLVNEGKVVKKGERRWTTYSVVS